MPETIAERARIMAETIFDILNLGDSSGMTIKRVETYILTELANAQSDDEPDIDEAAEWEDLYGGDNPVEPLEDWE